jgi:hypothetical protein
MDCVGFSIVGTYTDGLTEWLCGWDTSQSKTTFEREVRVKIERRLWLLVYHPTEDHQPEYPSVTEYRSYRNGQAFRACMRS